MRTERKKLSTRVQVCAIKVAKSVLLRWQLKLQIDVIFFCQYLWDTRFLWGQHSPNHVYLFFYVRRCIHMLNTRMYTHAQHTCSSDVLTYTHTHILTRIRHTCQHRYTYTHVHTHTHTHTSTRTYAHTPRMYTHSLTTNKTHTHTHAHTCTKYACIYTV